MTKYFSTKKDGFSFMGVTIATFVATIGMMAIFSLVSDSIKASAESVHSLVASGLAQEGIEVVRGVRQANANWSDWEWHSTVPIGVPVTYCPQYNTVQLIAPCTSDGRLKLDEVSGVYQYDSGVDSDFYRKVILTRFSDDEVKVVAEVKWLTRSGNWRTLLVEDRLWNWY